MQFMQISTALSVFALASMAAAGGGKKKEEHHDVNFQPEAGAIVTGILEDGVPFEHERVFGAELGETGIPGFGDEPGFITPASSLPPASQMGWNATVGLKIWDGTTFVDADSARLTASFLGDSFVVTSAGPVAGFMLDVQPDGGFHRHLNFLLEDIGGGTAAAGVYLLELNLMSTAFDASEPFWLVFNNEATEEEHEAAEDWVRDELATTPCPEDLDVSGAVDFNDLLSVLSAWGPCTDCPADLDSSGMVDFTDLVTVLSAWGACP